MAKVRSQPRLGLRFSFSVDGLETEAEATTEKVLKGLTSDDNLYIQVDWNDCRLAERTFYLDDMELDKPVEVPLSDAAVACAPSAVDEGLPVYGQGTSTFERSLTAKRFGFKVLIVKVVQDHDTN